jgi:hypothetical protein
MDAAGRAGHPGVFVLPMIPLGSPLPSPNAARPAFRHPAPACSLQPPTVESDNALGEAQGDRLLVDIGGVGRAGKGKRTPAITSPLSFDLTGVRFQRRIRLARGPPNPSALSTYHPTGRSGMAKPPRSKGLALTAHIGTYALPSSAAVGGRYGRSGGHLSSRSRLCQVGTAMAQKPGLFSTDA